MKKDDKQQLAKSDYDIDQSLFKRDEQKITQRKDEKY